MLPSPPSTLVHPNVDEGWDLEASGVVVGQVGLVGIAKGRFGEAHDPHNRQDGASRWLHKLGVGTREVCVETVSEWKLWSARDALDGNAGCVGHACELLKGRTGVAMNRQLEQGA